MKGIWEFTKNILSQLIASALFTLFGTSLASYNLTGNIFSFFKTISGWHILLIIFVLIFGSIIFYAFKVDKENSVAHSSIYVPMFKDNYYKHAIFEYNGLKWEILYPKPHSSHFQYGSIVHIDSDKYCVYETPICPNCETYLDENKAVFSRYKWVCPKCKFTKRIKFNHNVLVSAANKVAKSTMREEGFHGKQLYAEGAYVKVK